MGKVRKIVSIIAVASLLIGYVLQVLIPEKRIDERQRLKEIAPELSFSAKTGNPPHYRATDGSVAFSSQDITPHVRGYAGPITTLLILNTEGKITGITIIDHHETKNYVHYMVTPDYLNRFIGKNVADPFIIDKDVDAITRATVSVEALARTIRESSRLVATNVLGMDIRSEGANISRGLGWLLYLGFFASALIAYFVTRRSRKLLRARDLTLLAGIAIIGLYLSSPFSIMHVFNLLFLKPSSSYLWYAIISTTIFSVLIAGRFYCGWLCPFGAISEFIGRLPVSKWSISPEVDDRWRDMKYIILGLASVIVFTSRRPEFGNYETYVTLFSLNGSYLAWGLVGLTLAANLKIKRFWCRYLCPVAALTGLLAIKSPGYPSTKDCPIGNRPSPLISECIRCNKCFRSASVKDQGTTQ